MYLRLYVEYPLLLSHYKETWILSTGFRKIPEYQISWKSVQREPICSMRTDGQTDIKKLIVAFQNFANAPKHWRRCLSNKTLCLLTSIRFWRWSMCTTQTRCLKSRPYFRPQMTWIRKCIYSGGGHLRNSQSVTGLAQVHCPIPLTWL